MHPGKKYGFARQNGVSSAPKRAAGSANAPPSSGPAIAPSGQKRP
jgi:hypothetical protein